LSKIFVEQIDSSNYTTTLLFTSSIFTMMPLFIPWVQPPPIRKYRISFNGNSTSFLSNIVTYWRPEASIVTISNYAQPSNKYNIGNFYNYNAVPSYAYFGPPYSMIEAP
jgi:hypothetical protein